MGGGARDRCALSHGMPGSQIMLQPDPFAVAHTLGQIGEPLLRRGRVRAGCLAIVVRLHAEFPDGVCLDWQDIIRRAAGLPRIALNFCNISVISNRKSPWTTRV